MRILEYLNLSNDKNLDADSGYSVFKNKVKHILAKRDDFHFYYVCPRQHYDKIKRDMWQYKDRLTLLPVEMLTANSGSRYHIDLPTLNKYIKPYERDYDILSIQEPPLVAGMFELFNGRNHFNAPIHTYVHWICKDVGIKVNAHERLSYIAGLFLSSQAGCNSEFGKKMIIAQAKEYYNDRFIEILDRKLSPLHVGADVENLIHTDSSSFLDNPDKKETSIIFNHRLNQYTNYRFIISELERLYQKRQDFVLYVTNPSKMSVSDIERMKTIPFIRFTDLSFNEYVDLMKRCDIALCPHVGDNQWSISLIEAVSCGCIPLASSKAFQKEILFNFEDDFFYHANHEFLARLEHMLNEKTAYKKRTLAKREVFANHWSWRNVCTEYIQMFDKLYAESDIVSADCDSMKRIRNIITTSKQISKKSLLKNQLKWSDFIVWTKYRRRILEEFDELITSSDVIYHVRGNKVELQKELF